MYRVDMSKYDSNYSVARVVAGMLDAITEIESKNNYSIRDNDIMRAMHYHCDEIYVAESLMQLRGLDTKKYNINLIKYVQSRITNLPHFVRHV